MFFTNGRVYQHCLFVWQDGFNPALLELSLAAAQHVSDRFAFQVAAGCLLMQARPFYKAFQRVDEGHGRVQFLSLAGNAQGSHDTGIAPT